MKIQLLSQEHDYEIETWELTLTDDDKVSLFKEHGIPLDRLRTRITFRTANCFDVIVFQGPYTNPIEAILAPIAEKLRAQVQADHWESNSRTWAEKNGYALLRRSLVDDAEVYVALRDACDNAGCFDLSDADAWSPSDAVRNLRDYGFEIVKVEKAGA